MPVSARRRALVQWVGQQSLVGNNPAIIKRLCAVARQRTFKEGAVLIKQESKGRDLYLILSGRVSILVHGRRIGERTSKQHVGEMGLIDPSAVRSATVVAETEVITAKISEPDFSKIAIRYPDLWRRLALELAERLRKRNELVAAKNPVPVLFIGSSNEAVPVVEALRRRLVRNRTQVKIVAWHKDVFHASETVIESLEKNLKAADFAALIISPDDKVVSRSKRRSAPRDNVIFELGLFMGALGRTRTYMLVPTGMDVKIPTDLLTVTYLHYEPATKRKKADLSEACRAMSERIEALRSK
jgi:CRP/FNR family transcriptional regulator, cyclic AMP receptor protein